MILNVPYYREMSINRMDKQISKCCKAPIRVAHGHDWIGYKPSDDVVTMWNECANCKEPCDYDVDNTDNK
jgi:hypothetical protein